jgi:Uma2 family endonuclease
MVPINRKPRLEQVDPPRSPREILPTMYDLPSENPEEPGLPDEFHDLQPQLLSRTLWLSTYTRENCFTASDLNLYYDINHPLWYKRPDWFLAVDVPRLYDGKDLRRSYVIWQEGKSPYVVIEFLSPGTEAEDLGRFYTESPTGANTEVLASVPESRENGSELAQTNPPAKFQVYEHYLRIPHYLVYDRMIKRLRHFKLDGGRYQEQALNPEHPVAWLMDLDIGLGLWQGEFEGVPGAWLRWCDRDGQWLLTDAEQAERSAMQERVAREQAEAQVLQAAQNLLASGMEISQVAQLLNLSDAQVESL